MVEPLSVNTDGVRSLGDIHTGVAAGLGSLAAGTPGAADVATSHGAIAYGVDTALTAALGSRSGSMNVTQASGAHISELLHQAALAYERGDQRGAEAIRAAADTIAQGGAPATGGVPATSSSASSGGTDAIGQAVGQLGQLGQLGQQLGAPLAALAQPLQQLPQQIMQGVQQMAQSATQSTDSDASSAPGAGDGPEPESAAEEHAAPEALPGDAEAAGAQPGAGAAPVAPAVEEQAAARSTAD